MRTLKNGPAPARRLARGTEPQERAEERVLPFAPSRSQGKGLRPGGQREVLSPKAWSFLPGRSFSRTGKISCSSALSSAISVARAKRVRTQIFLCLASFSHPGTQKPEAPKNGWLRPPRPHDLRIPFFRKNVKELRHTSKAPGRSIKAKQDEELTSEGHPSLRSIDPESAACLNAAELKASSERPSD